jgi:hypothetical protein
MLQTRGVGAKPQCPLPVLDQVKIGHDSSLRVGLINCETSGRGIETIQTVAGGDPERSVAFDEKACHDVVAQTVWIGRIVEVRMESARPSVKAEQPVVISSSPELAGTDFANRDHIGIGCWSGRPAVESVVPGLAVDRVERSGRTDPQEFLRILVYCANEGFGRTIRTGEMSNSLNGRGIVAKWVTPILPRPAQMLPSRSANRFSTLFWGRLSRSPGLWR